MIQYAVTAVIVIVVLASPARDEPHAAVRLETLWIVRPSISCRGRMFYEFPAERSCWLMCAAGLPSGRHRWRAAADAIMSIPNAHADQKASPAAFVFIVILVLFRFGARGMMERRQLWRALNTMLITDVLSLSPRPVRGDPARNVRPRSGCSRAGARA